MNEIYVGNYTILYRYSIPTTLVGKENNNKMSDVFCENDKPPNPLPPCYVYSLSGILSQSVERI